MASANFEIIIIECGPIILWSDGFQKRWRFFFVEDLMIQPKFGIGQKVQIGETSELAFRPGETMFVVSISNFNNGSKDTFLYTCRFTYPNGVSTGLTSIEERFLEPFVNGPAN